MALLTSRWYGDLMAVIFTLLAVIVFYFKRSYSYWSKRGVVSSPPTIPFGNVSDILMQKVSLAVGLKSMYDKFKKMGVRYAGFYFLHKPVFLPLDPELVKTMMTKDFQHFVDHGNYVNEEVDPLSGHLFSLKGQKWRNLRAKLTPTFTSGKMKMMFPILLECSTELDVLLDRSAQDHSPIDIKELMGRFTTDVIGSCAFGIECNSLKDPKSEFMLYGKKFFEADFFTQIKNLVAFVCPHILYLFKVGAIRKDVGNFFMNVVTQTVNYREQNNVIRKDFMHLLIQLKNNVELKDHEHVNELVAKSNATNEDAEPGTTLNINELAAQAFVFFIAGYETSSTTLSFIFFELAHNPLIQHKLRQEIFDVLDKHNGEITYDAIQELHYMQRCIDESLRKYPPISLLNRECTEEYKVPGSDLIIEKGSLVFIPIHGMQHDPENFPDPEKFDPDRFTNLAKATRHPFTWLPFGEGPRFCIGVRFGLMQIKVALVVLLRYYKILVHPKTKIPLEMDPKKFISEADGGIWLLAEKI